MVAPKRNSGSANCERLESRVPSYWEDSMADARPKSKSWQVVGQNAADSAATRPIGPALIKAGFRTPTRSIVNASRRPKMTHRKHALPGETVRFSETGGAP